MKSAKKKIQDSHNYYVVGLYIFQTDAFIRLDNKSCQVRLQSVSINYYDSLGHILI